MVAEDAKIRSFHFFVHVEEAQPLEAPGGGCLAAGEQPAARQAHNNHRCGQHRHQASLKRPPEPRVLLFQKEAQHFGQDPGQQDQVQSPGEDRPGCSP